MIAENPNSPQAAKDSRKLGEAEEKTVGDLEALIVWKGLRDEVLLDDVLDEELEDEVVLAEVVDNVVVVVVVGAKVVVVVVVVVETTVVFPTGPVKELPALGQAVIVPAVTTVGPV